jgi:TolB protein
MGEWSGQLLLNRYRVGERLPGEAETYRAWDAATDKPVNLRRLAAPPEDETRRALEEKARSLGKYLQAGLLPFYGLLEVGAEAFLAEGHVEGPSLSRLNGKLPVTDALSVLKTLSAQVDALHRAGWSHAPRLENITLDREGRLYLGALFEAQPFESPQDDIRALAELFTGLVAEVLPEFATRILPRALEPKPDSRFGNATEFFLTLCLACRVEAESLSGRLSGADSPAAGLLREWPFLPPAASLRPVTVQPAPARKRTPAGAWTWPLALLAIVGAFASAWWLLPAPIAAPITEAAPAPTNVPISLPEEPEAPVFSAPTLAPAPDSLGGRIVFTCTRREINHICMVSPQGGDISLLTAERAHDYYPTFSRDGNMILFASNRGGSFNLYLKLLQSDILTRLTDGPGEISSSAFSADGSLIAFASSLDGQPADLWLMSREGRNPRLLYDGAGNIASPAWSPNGASIAFVMSQPETPGMYEVYILELLSGQVSSVTNGRFVGAGGSVDWSPDGRFLVFFAGSPGNNEILRYEIPTGEFLQLTSGGNNAAPAFSPDGEWIVFNSQRNGNADLFIMRIDGSDVQQITDDPEPDWQARWGR